MLLVPVLLLLSRARPPSPSRASRAQCAQGRPGAGADLWIGRRDTRYGRPRDDGGATCPIRTCFTALWKRPSAFPTLVRPQAPPDGPALARRRAGTAHRAARSRLQSRFSRAASCAVVSCGGACLWGAAAFSITHQAAHSATARGVERASSSLPSAGFLFLHSAPLTGLRGRPTTVSRHEVSTVLPCASPRPALLSLSTLRAAGRSARPQRHHRHAVTPVTAQKTYLFTTARDRSRRAVISAIRTGICCAPTTSPSAANGTRRCRLHHSRPPAGAGTCTQMGGVPCATQAYNDSDDSDLAYSPPDSDTGPPSRTGSRRCM